MMKSSNVWIFGTIGVIWLVVLVTSLAAPDLRFGDEPVVLGVAAIANWFWGLLGTLFLLRSTLFRRSTEIGWGQDVAWPWVAGAVSGIWLVGAVVSLAAPEVAVTATVIIPAAAMVAPPVAVALTYSVTEFLVTGFAARSATDTPR